MPTILIAGGTGLVGNHLSQMLKAAGHEVLHLSRKQNLNAKFPAYAWDLTKKTIEQEAVDRADYIINLAGAGIADQRWTDERKRLIISSRVDSTLLLKAAIERRPTPLKAFISASAVGFYGSRGDNLMAEEDPTGTDSFLAESVAAWEKSVEKIAETSLRTVVIRVGVVLSTKGGALEKMLIPFNFFNATYFGNGQQWMSWVHIDDLCRMFVEAIDNEKMNGNYNGVAPHPARNKDLIVELKKAVGKPALVLPAPELVLRAAMGEMADVVFDSTRVSSKKIESAGFKFQFPDLLPALRDLLRRKI
ncbi:MAG: TIGR01777 family oxidoreductase [Saprospiraceae bacterium]|nr:TIGR01777 family oxidoreductase [Saprospiraceae bacterium]MCF8252886.1 TIGR01777 family oxidoreductase [Saprospiraceae bacterium]MCF8314432.1 TIGR01777 family oxidoreductase [Saprospiraceae bacterium]MCF8443322.1 TIGR01777 family oxidoreductase [Saprospiraceae bacterium]